MGRTIDIANAVGRPPKDLALVFRDRYWALSLQSIANGKSFAALERELSPNLRIRKRPDGEGNVQPFALSKVAKGTRGVSDSLGDIPEIVHAAEMRYPGSSWAYRSIFWIVLAKCEEVATVELLPLCISKAIRDRLREKHFEVSSVGRVCLTEIGLQRAGRLTHLDSLGLLLLTCSPVIKNYERSALANTYVPAALERLAIRDQIFGRLRSGLEDLLEDRFPGAMRGDSPFTVQTFQQLRGKEWLVPMGLSLKKRQSTRRC